MVTNIMIPLFLVIAMTIFFGKTARDIVLNSIGYIITLFSTLIYNELIIFNCCDLNKNTKKFVNKRLNEELEEIKKDEDIYPGSDNDSLTAVNN